MPSQKAPDAGGCPSVQGVIEGMASKGGLQAPVSRWYPLRWSGSLLGITASSLRVPSPFSHDLTSYNS